MNIKFIFTDLDGTLLDTAKKPGNKSIKVLKILKQRGFHLGIATGRSVDIVLNLLAEWGLDDQFDWIVGMNGAQLYNIKNHALYRQHLLTIDQLHKLISMLYSYDLNLYLYDCITHKAMLKRLDEFGAMIIKLNHSVYEIKNLTKLHKEYEKLLVLAEPSLLLDINQKLINYEGINVMRTLPYCLEIVNQHNSKLNAIRQICNYEKVDLSAVMAFGDQENDMEMIMECGLGVAMLNGLECLKQKADMCTEYTNENDGVGEFLNTYFQLKQ